MNKTLQKLVLACIWASILGYGVTGPVAAQEPNRELSAPPSRTSNGTDGVVQLSIDAKPLLRILIPKKCTAPTRFAAEELAKTLEDIVGSQFEIAVDHSMVSGPAVFVGASDSAKKFFSDIEFSELASEEIIIKAKDQQLLLAGGGTRGDIYAVSRFLQEQCGVRWWTPWATRIPKNPDLTVGDLNVRYRPPFEFRQPYWRPAFDPLWSVRNTCNGEVKPSIPPEMGDCIHYKGFVHTFYSLVPPELHFQDHPEWFSLIKGKRTHERAQLCLTNAELRDFVVKRVKQWLRESPEVAIISVSQNDWDGTCECDSCRLLRDREESESGPILDFVNYVAQKIEDRFPHVLVDTLAYQYSRQAPKTLRPRKNVVIRLCSDVCNLREPLDHVTNGAFSNDLRTWAALTDRLYVWDYTANFSHFVQPHPNWFVLGPNLKILAHHHVKGVFAQGLDQSHGAEMAEMRAWVLAQLMWNPEQDDRALIREFLEGYYGVAAAPHIENYFELLHEASEGYDLTTYAASNAPFLQYEHLARSEHLCALAEDTVKDDRDLLVRVRLARLPLRYVWIKRWAQLREDAKHSTIPWPIADSREEVIEEWKTVVQGEPGKDWTEITFVDAGLTSDDFLSGKNLKD